MKIPRDLSGRELATRLPRAFGYRFLHQEGSHIVLQTETPRRHRTAVPDHQALRIGTLNGILRAIVAAQGIPKEEAFRRLFE
ncbi:MAG TPA: type II toxin-antitoxin system HicA family toxin [Planctomycetota bacterium]|nr:type II toxin-antitoxin system HicA family toxin [Planctomycetota bacterium]